MRLGLPAARVARGRRALTLDEIEVLTPERIAALPLDRIQPLIREVQMVGCPHGPSESELTGITDRVRAVFQALHREHLARTMRACGGPSEPYVVSRLPDPPRDG